MSGGKARKSKKASFVRAGRAKARQLQIDPATFTPHFSWEKKGNDSVDSERNRGAAMLRPYMARVRCEEVSLREVADSARTPTYVYSQAAIGDAYRELHAGLGALPHTLCFAVKSNGNLAILKYLAGL